MKVDREVVKHNIRMMRSEMLHLLVGESIKGSGGKIIAGANFVYERETGRILLFELPQNLPAGIQELVKSRQAELGVFKVEINLKQTLPKIIFAHYGKIVPQKAKAVLDASVAEYNQNIGWQ